jgi:hypothetical protein
LETWLYFGNHVALTKRQHEDSNPSPMKKRGFIADIRKGGILQWSTVCILAGGSAGLTGCDSKYTATPKDEQMAALQKKLDAVDTQKSRLMNGEVSNNFELPGVGFYHAEARDFFAYPFGREKDGRWYVNGQWQEFPAGEAHVSASRPTPEALKKVDLALEREQQLLTRENTNQENQTTTQYHQSGFGNALMMYWLLSGNRGAFTPGAGFQQATNQSGRWQQGFEQQRQSVSSHASANPGYRRMVEQSHATGRPVSAGQSVRGGFGSGGRTSSAS